MHIFRTVSVGKDNFISIALVCNKKQDNINKSFCVIEFLLDVYLWAFFQQNSIVKVHVLLYKMEQIGIVI